MIKERIPISGDQGKHIRKALNLILVLIFRIQFPVLGDPDLRRVVVANMTDGLALLTSCLLDLCQLTAGHIPENYETGLYDLAQSNIAESPEHFTAEIWYVTG